MVNFADKVILTTLTPLSERESAAIAEAEASGANFCLECRDRENSGVFLYSRVIKKRGQKVS